VASDPEVSERVRAAVDGRGFDERFMFGGPAWFLRDHFALGVSRRDLVARVGPDAAAAAIAAGEARPMDLTGRPMKGWVFVDPDSDVALADWVDRAETFVRSLPAKTNKPSPRRKK